MEKFTVEFEMDLKLRSIEYIIQYQKYYDLELIDELICTILLSKGPMCQSSLSKTIGLIITDDPATGLFADKGEAGIMKAYLKKLQKFDLINVTEENVSLTRKGFKALKSGSKYELLHSLVNLFEFEDIVEVPDNLSFLDSFSLPNKFEKIVARQYPKVIHDQELKQRLQGQLFAGSIEFYEIREIQETKPNPGVKSLKIMIKLRATDDGYQISVFCNGQSQPSFDLALVHRANEKKRNAIIRKGEFEYFYKNAQRISAEDIERFFDLWDYSRLVERKELVWDDKVVFELFTRYAKGSAWISISRHAPLECIWSLIEQYKDYWNWRVLTERFETDKIGASINRLPWDLEELSDLDADSIIKLLTLGGGEREEWNWSKLSQSLPNKFILEYIDDYPWDFFLITTEKFEVFKTLFASPENRMRQLQVNWNWNYVFKEIKIRYLFQHLSDFDFRIDWTIVLERFFNDPEIIKLCLNDKSFIAYLTERLPANFVISHQKYIWTLETLSFFDSMGRINWETNSYMTGIDTSPHIIWDEAILIKFHQRITTHAGKRHISCSICSTELLRKFESFEWNWDAISRNMLLMADRDYISDLILRGYKEVALLDWGLIYTYHHNGFWQPLLTRLANYFTQKHITFWNKATVDIDLNFILVNPDLPWNWMFISQDVHIDLVENLVGSGLYLDKWNWKIISKRLPVNFIFVYLEEYSSYWDWQYLIDNSFTIDDLDLASGHLSRVAACLSKIESETRSSLWQKLSRKFPIETLFNYIELTAGLAVFEWDWDMISVHKHLPGDIGTLNELRHRLNWSLFSSGPMIRKKFSFSSYQGNPKIFFDTVSTYLKRFSGFWDWSKLSQHPSLNENRRILRTFKDKLWDWDYLSSNGRFLLKRENDNENYLSSLCKQFPIQYGVLSSRKDIEFTSKFILEYSNFNWNWGQLSRNPKVEMTPTLLIELSEKDWDWKYLTNRIDLALDNTLLRELVSKDWDWGNLSQSKGLIFDYEFIIVCLDKPLDWRLISCSDQFVIGHKTLHLLKDYGIDWKHISKNIGPEINVSLLNQFEDYLDWESLTKNENINLSNVELLERFMERWDWRYICKYSAISLDTLGIEKFKSYLDWSTLSENYELKFSKTLIDLYYYKWDWPKLRSNPGVGAVLHEYIEQEINESPDLRLICDTTDKNKNYGGYIYHFSHIENAVDIIRNSSIKSRNSANIKADAAGTVVHLRDDAHEYARFYFRPKTPTQFYNEFLGKRPIDGYYKGQNWVSWYEKARALGHPKCPVPIFFRFNMHEVLFAKGVDCRISNGNMQTSSTSFGKIAAMIDRFNVDRLYLTPPNDPWKWGSDDYKDYIDFAQQEFLVKGELDFSKLRDYQIICSCDEDKKLLLALLGDSAQEFIRKILVDSSYYNSSNPRIMVSTGAQGTLEISNELDSNGYMTLAPFYDKDLEKITSGKVERLIDNRLVFKTDLRLENFTHPFRLTFTDESSRNWFIYDRSSDCGIMPEQMQYDPRTLLRSLKEMGYQEDFETKIDHYTLEKHTLIVCSVFERYFSGLFSGRELLTMRYLLVLHDIGKAKAHLAGDKGNQSLHTLTIVENLSADLQLDDTEVQLILSMLKGDIMGNYFKGDVTLESTVDTINLLAWEINIDAQRFFYLMLVYYQCDTAAYTIDEGGLKFLERLFEYQGGNKIFVEDNGLLKFSPIYHQRYQKLENYFCYANQAH